MNATISTTTKIPDAISTKTAARMLGVSWRTVQWLAVCGDLPGAFRVGVQWRINTRKFLAAYGLEWHE